MREADNGSPVEELYTQDPRFRANYDRTDPRLAEFMRAAMTAYAEARLS